MVGTFQNTLDRLFSMKNSPRHKARFNESTGQVVHQIESNLMLNTMSQARIKKVDHNQNDDSSYFFVWYS